MISRSSNSLPSSAMYLLINLQIIDFVIVLVVLKINTIFIYRGVGGLEPPTENPPTIHT